MSSTCNVCGGKGTKVDEGDGCGDCGGVGRVREERKVKVDVPAGVSSGTRMRLAADGDAPLSGAGPPGELYITLSVAASPHFTRQGPTLFHTSKIPFHIALLGGKVRVPTLEGEVDVRVPGGTQAGEEMCLRGRGVREIDSRGSPGKARGDLMVAFNLIIPRYVSLPLFHPHYL